PEAVAFCKDILGELLTYEKEHDGSLLATLETYLFYNCNKAELARRMYLHINTVQYRINKIEEILGVDLDEQEARLNLSIALKIYPLVKEKILLE
ncbi:MAG TPA: helix-turn-helix domain-containing protein, partial [Fervidobacterium sp.]|nr:helix-turn-helix domain-containing protein [Fervidobacterium sp.]